ncbi:MAG: hypothetical protein C0599_09400 [Salinivirgaceae bacterium]|nr:MAG: hypothetical protein C0599_09400 [Salinivirgaceae bacterium]
MQKPYVCPYCKKEYPLPPKACSCESFEMVEETRYYFLLNDPKQLEEFKSVLEINAKEITKEEFLKQENKGYYVEEKYMQGIETLGTFTRTIIKID